MSLTSLRLYDFSDRELLFVLHGEMDQEGWSSTHDIAEELGIEHDHPAQCVGSRLAVLKRYCGVVVRKKGESKWKLTEAGEMMMLGQLSESQEGMLNEMPDEEALLVTRWAAKKQRSSRRKSTQGMLRREWAYGTHRNGS